MSIMEAIEKRLESIIFEVGEVSQELKEAFEKGGYYYTGVYDYASGVGCVPPCDIQMYKNRGCDIFKVQKWVRRGCFAC